MEALPKMVDLTEYTGKKVVVTVKAEDDGSEELEGKVEAASAIGLLLKPKGRTDLRLLEADDILDVETGTEPVRKLTVKYIKEVDEGQYRRHLVDRHGMTLSYINTLTEDQAKEIHESTDHSDLGHQHGERPKRASTRERTARDEAIEAAEASVAS
jgi:hypothetical protein